MIKDKEPTTVVDFDDITLESLKEATPNVLKVHKNGIYFYLKIKLKTDNNNLVVFSNGAYNPQKSNPPIFSRSSWHSDFNANCIFIDDITIHNTECTLGWGVGTPDRYFLLEYSQIIQKVKSVLLISDENVVYFGSSAGGFMSMMLATFHKGSLAVPNNPQIYAHKFGRGVAVNKLYNTRFPNMNENEIHKKFGDRFSLTEMIKRMAYTPKVLYLINAYSEEDVEKQYKPFVEDIKNIDIDDTRIEFLFYHADRGHEGIYSREKSAGIVNAYFNGHIHL